MYRLRFKIGFSDERLTTPNGLSIIGGILGKSDFVKRCDRCPVDKKHSEYQIKERDILFNDRPFHFVFILTKLMRF